MPKKRLIKPPEWVAIFILQIYFALFLWVNRLWAYGPRIFVEAFLAFLGLDIIAMALIYLVARRRYRKPEKADGTNKFEKIFEGIILPAGAIALMISLGFSRGARSALLIGACYSGNDLAVRFLISTGVDINHLEDNATPLTAASVSNHPTTVEILLHNGANADLPGFDGKTALSIAEEKHNRSVADLLRAAGATK